MNIFSAGVVARQNDFGKHHKAAARAESRGLSRQPLGSRSYTTSAKFNPIKRWLILLRPPVLSFPLKQWALDFVSFRCVVLSWQNEKKIPVALYLKTELLDRMQLQTSRRIRWPRWLPVSSLVSSGLSRSPWHHRSPLSSATKPSSAHLASHSVCNSALYCTVYFTSLSWDLREPHWQFGIMVMVGIGCLRRLINSSLVMWSMQLQH